MTAPDFASLGLSAPLAQACTQAGLVTPTQIQREAIPAVLRGTDLLGLAPTGSGKTAAFALPLLQRLAAARQGYRRSVRVLVLVPTRELAAQVGGVFSDLSRFAPAPPRRAIILSLIHI